MRLRGRGPPLEQRAGQGAAAPCRLAIAAGGTWRADLNGRDGYGRCSPRTPLAQPTRRQRRPERPARLERPGACGSGGPRRWRGASTSARATPASGPRAPGRCSPPPPTTPRPAAPAATPRRDRGRAGARYGRASRATARRARCVRWAEPRARPSAPRPPPLARRRVGFGRRRGGRFLFPGLFDRRESSRSHGIRLTGGPVLNFFGFTRRGLVVVRSVEHLVHGGELPGLLVLAHHPPQIPGFLQLMQGGGDPRPPFLALLGEGTDGGTGAVREAEEVRQYAYRAPGETPVAEKGVAEH